MSGFQNCGRGTVPLDGLKMIPMRLLPMADAYLNNPKRVRRLLTVPQPNAQFLSSFCG